MRTWRMARLSVRARLEYRFEVLVAVLVGALWQASVLMFATVLLSRFPGLGGWPSRDVLLIVAIRTLAHGLAVTVFNGLKLTPFLVQDGLIEAYLLRPLPVYRQVLLSSFHVPVVGDLIVAVSLFTLALSRLELDWTIGRVAYLAVAVGNGALLEAALYTLIAGWSLTSTGTRAWSVWTDELLATFGNYPLHILPPALFAGFTVAFPVAFVAYLPAAALTGHPASTGLPSWVVLGSPAVGLPLFMLARLRWAAQLARYESVGG